MMRGMGPRPYLSILGPVKIDDVLFMLWALAIKATPPLPLP